MNLKNNLFNIIFGVLTLLITILFYEKILLVAILLLALAVIALIKWNSKVTLLVFIFGAIFGTIAEIISIRFGLWSYSITSIFEVPYWLFVVWGNAAIFIYHLALGFRRNLR